MLEKYYEVIKWVSYLIIIFIFILKLLQARQCYFIFIISQLLYRQQFDSRKRLNMQSGQEAKSVQKNSSHDSDDRKRERPSLFPIRNSARRKSSMLESKSIFDPHDTECNSNRLLKKNQQSDTQDNHETKSEAEFQYRTPSGISEYSSPRSSKSSPKTFIADTPYVPFVHQSLTKTVWESEDIIPQQRDDIDRKQSQTQMPKNNVLDNPIKQERQFQTHLQKRNSIQGQLYPSLPNLNLNTHQDNKDNIKIEQNQNFQTCLSLSISVPPQQNHALDIPSYVSQQNKQKSQQNINQSYVLKQEVENDPAYITYQVQNTVEHHQYVSKADIIQREEMQKMAQDKNQSLYQHQPTPDPVQKPRPLSFSYIELISIRPIYKQIQSYSQQTSPKKLSQGKISPIVIDALQKNSCFTQSQKNKLEICNPSHFDIKSTKKQNNGAQTLSYRDKLKIIQKSYQQKIGTSKQYIISSQQTQSIKVTHNATQTLKNQANNLTIKEQVNLSFNYNYRDKSDEKLEKLETYIKNIYEKKQNQIIQLRNRRSVEISVNTEEAQPNQSNKSSPKIMTKTVRDTGCQYDQKDIGTGRPSLKRVSIAAAPIIHEIADDSNSTQTFQQQQQKQQVKQKSKSKQKGKSKQRQSKNDKKIKLQNKQQVDQYVPEQEEIVHEEVKKSKRKASKTPRKKGRY